MYVQFPQWKIFKISDKVTNIESIRLITFYNFVQQINCNYIIHISSYIQATKEVRKPIKDDHLFSLCFHTIINKTSQLPFARRAGPTPSSWMSRKRSPCLFQSWGPSWASGPILNRIPRTTVWAHPRTYLSEFFHKKLHIQHREVWHHNREEDRRIFAVLKYKILKVQYKQMRYQW